MSYLNTIGGGWQSKWYTFGLRKSIRTTYYDYSSHPGNNVQQAYVVPVYDLDFLTIRCDTSPMTGDYELKWRVTTSGSVMPQNQLTFPVDTPQLQVDIVATQGYKEIFDIQYEQGDWSWRTDLFTGSTQSTLNVTYDEANAYEVYVNNELLCTISQPQIYNIYFTTTTTTTINSWSDSSITTPYYTEMPVQPPTNYIYGYFPFPEGSYTAAWDSGKNPVMHNTFSCQFAPSRIEFASNVTSQTGLSSGRPHITFPTQNTLYYKYKVDNPELANAQFETLEGNSWTGLESPYFYYMNSGDMKIQFPQITGQNIQVSCSTENRYSFNQSTGQAEYRFGNDKTIPGAIGMVSVKTVTHHHDPQSIFTDWKTNGINNYNVKSTKDINGKEEKDTEDDVRFNPNECTNEINNILKIQLMPPISQWVYGADLFKVQEKEICNNSNWQYSDCEVITGGYVYANTDGAFVYKDFYRPRYLEEKDPNNVLHNTNYRQRHFTHLRYMKTNFKKVVQTEVEGQTVEEEVAYTPPIELIYKGFGKYCTGHTWTAEFDTITQCYDLLTCNGTGEATVDECLSLIKSEDYKLYKEHTYEDDPEGEITYLYERPLLAKGYLPNIVGRIKIPIPADTKIKLSDIDSVLSPDINLKPLELTWRATENIADFNYRCDDLITGADWQGYDHLVYSVEKEYSATEYSRYYRILTNRFTLNSATITVHGDYINQVITLDGNWQNTFEISKLNGFTIDMYFTEISTGYVIHASHYITGSNSPDCQDYFRFRLHTESQTIGVECEEARWVVEGNEYTLDEYERLKVMSGQYYAKDIPKHEITFQCGTEFKKMEYVGEHEPGPEEEGTTNSWDTYAGRYVAVAINGARCGDIPEMIRKRAPHSQTSETLNMTLKQYSTLDAQSPSNQCPVIFPRDDLGEFAFNTQTYNPDSNGYYPLATIYNGQDTRVHYLECWNTIVNGEWKQCVVAIPEVDKIISSYMTRTLKIGTEMYAPERNSTEVVDYITVKGDFGGIYNGVTNKLLPTAPEGAVLEHSPILDTTSETNEELPIDYIDVYGAYRDTNAPSQSSWIKGERTLLNDRKHATSERTPQTEYKTKWRINNHSREPYILDYGDFKYGIIDGMKYTLSYIKEKGGKILRNLAGKILRNTQGKILRGDDM